MKTLLLTLVVVTIVCLDLGYTIVCHTTATSPISAVTCPPGENLCYRKMWCDVFCSSRGKVVELGCAATCPSKKPYEEVTCCSTDKCNPHPKQRPG
uniref:Alpha-bungarotoxin isoform V31 n=4 Tax=Bungarus multicinctus TaxID=8616 RepID=3L21V_BUNMU|nr:RecName: Full=Alpha-bungarotoxin isoform V31; Short=Alpha-BTX V31; Short=Alpha-Bgt(V31); Short=BGTX V31; AltName: Full=Long neurotoxin 1; Flags: Precursor [Bungarus multicinctus]CAB51841.1 alpha-bungarotoxin (V31) [Bungarus multicinctus]CAB51843.1 alpha-bungarotoxin (V31) [Bungarus multicinctus]